MFECSAKASLLGEGQSPGGENLGLWVVECRHLDGYFWGYWLFNMQFRPLWAWTLFLSKDWSYHCAYWFYRIPSLWTTTAPTCTVVPTSSPHGQTAAAKWLQSCLTLCDPIDSSPPGSSVPGILQARTLEWVAICFSNAWKRKVKVKSLSRAQLLATPWTAAYQASLSMGFSRQEYWSGLPVLRSRLIIRVKFQHNLSVDAQGLIRE